MTHPAEVTAPVTRVADAPHDAPCPTGAAGGTAQRDDLTAAAVTEAVEETCAHSGSVFLLSPDRRSLELAATWGRPPSQEGGWHRIAVNSSIPVAEAYRSGRMVHLANPEETMRRFPQLAVAVPYAFGSASVPVKAGDETIGAMAVVWATRPVGGGPDSAPPRNDGLSRAQRRRLRATANRLGAALAELGTEGRLVKGNGRTLPVTMPTARSDPAVRVGLFDWDLDTGALTADDELCAIFGMAPETFDGRADTLAARIFPADLPGFRAAARTAVEEGHVRGPRLRIAGPRGMQRAVELWGCRSEAADREAGAHLVGAVLDPGAGVSAVEAIERLEDGFFSLDPEGRLGYANRGLERLLHLRREDLLGQRPWDVVPWLSDPVYEDRYRAAMISQQPVSFRARRPPDRWLAFSLHPDPHGTTGWVVPIGRPSPAVIGSGASGTSEASAAAEEAAEAPEAPDPTGVETAADPNGAMAGPPSLRTSAAMPTRLGAMYHVLQMGSALTEAITTREVCQVVIDQLLPAFGGQKLAIFSIRERLLRLLAQVGYPAGFLDRFEGAPLDTRLPTLDTLRSGSPIFLESRQALSSAYPTVPAEEDTCSWAYLPLIASNRPVGACAVGFDEPHNFTTEERTVLTALGGLIAQALERARLYDAEFALARGLQHALLPHRLPSLPGVRITGRYLPGTRGMDVGGDWYDVIRTGRGIALIVGDVEGHNVAAAATMGQLRSAVRAFATVDHPPSDVIASTNRLLFDLDPGLLASCCYVRLDHGTGEMCAVSAGHLPPLLRHPDGRAEPLNVPGGPILGVDIAADYPETRMSLLPGSILALYTDGLVEERGLDIGVGIDRLRASLAHAGVASLDELADRLLRQVGPNHEDDVALLLTEYAPDLPH